MTEENYTFLKKCEMEWRREKTNQMREREKDEEPQQGEVEEERIK
jgi:hypothetical protein